jgi:hypothetical protein
MKPWSIDGADSVKWLAEQPFPIFLCVVEKSAGRFRLYQTLPRHLLHAHPPLPDRIKLVPTEGTDGQATQWKRGLQSLSLSAPILDFRLDKFLDDSFISLAKSVILEWVLWDSKNIHMRNSGMLQAAMPVSYRTNEPLPQNGSVRDGRIAREEQLAPALENLSRNLLWAAHCMAHTGKAGVAVRMALLLRRLNVDCSLDLCFLLSELCTHHGLPSPKHIDSFAAGLDKIDEAIEALLPDGWKGEPLPPLSQLRHSTWKLRQTGTRSAE